MSSCVYIPHVEVSPGVYAPSNLWQELQATFKDRATTKEWYAVATNPDIIAELKSRDDYVTNEQGEVTLACLQRNIESFMPDSDIVSETAEKYTPVLINAAVTILCTIVVIFYVSYSNSKLLYFSLFAP